MDGFIIRATGSTPTVEFNPEEGYLDITGISTPDDPLSFYGHVFSQLHKFEKHQRPVIQINFALKNMTGSTTYIYILVKKLLSLANENRRIEFCWYYEKNNQKILDAGKEISEHYNMPFKFVGVYKIKEHLRQAS